MSLFETSNTKFLWNGYILKDFKIYKISKQWQIPLIQVFLFKMNFFY